VTGGRGNWSGDMIRMPLIRVLRERPVVIFRCRIGRNVEYTLLWAINYPGKGGNIGTIIPIFSAYNLVIWGIGLELGITKNPSFLVELPQAQVQAEYCNNTYPSRRFAWFRHTM